jgi:hypothetical protein
MKKKLFILTVVSLMVCLIGFVAIACACDDDGDGKSNQRHLYLYQKTPQQDPHNDFPLNDQNWPIVTRGAWGKMEYKLSGPIFIFEFEGKKLEAGKSYTLIYYPDNPFGGLIYFGSDVADKHGNVQIGGSLDTGDLPASYDFNYPVGAKIWLVLSSDICFRGTAAPFIKNYTLDKYLFEEKLITFDSPEDRDCMI